VAGPRQLDYAIAGVLPTRRPDAIVRASKPRAIFAWTGDQLDRRSIEDRLAARRLQRPAGRIRPAANRDCGSALTAAIVQCVKCGKKNRVPAAATGVPQCGNCGTPLPWITEADDATFSSVVEASKLPVLVDVWAPWCGPCQMVSPILERLASEYAGRVKLVKVNADNAAAVSHRLGAQAIPTLVVMRDGKEVARHVGAGPERLLRRWLDDALGATAARTEMESG
jgi:thioredoxin 2